MAAAGYDTDSCQRALDQAGGDVIQATRTMAASLLGPTTAAVAWPEDWKSRDSQRRRQRVADLERREDGAGRDECRSELRERYEQEPADHHRDVDAVYYARRQCVSDAELSRRQAVLRQRVKTEAGWVRRTAPPHFRYRPSTALVVRTDHGGPVHCPVINVLGPPPPSQAALAGPRRRLLTVDEVHDKLLRGYRLTPPVASTAAAGAVATGGRAPPTPSDPPQPKRRLGLPGPWQREREAEEEQEVQCADFLRLERAERRAMHAIMLAIRR